MRVVKEPGGHAEKRYVIETPVRLGVREDGWPIEVTLANRSGRQFAMLLGRTAVRRRFALDPARSTAGFAVRRRLPWLQINLLTAFLAAAVVALFEGVIAQFTALAVLLPIVAGQGSNAGAEPDSVAGRTTGARRREVAAL